MSSTVLRLAAEAGEHHEKINHWIIGAIAFAILMALLGALLIFGAGREHS